MSVIKATANNHGPAWTYIEEEEDIANHLLFLNFNLEKMEVEVVFNGPQSVVFDMLPHKFSKKWEKQKQVTPNEIRKADKLVSKNERLKSPY